MNHPIISCPKSFTSSQPIIITLASIGQSPQASSHRQRAGANGWALRHREAGTAVTNGGIMSCRVVFPGVAYYFHDDFQDGSTGRCYQPAEYAAFVSAIRQARVTHGGCTLAASYPTLSRSITRPSEGVMSSPCLSPYLHDSL